MKVEEKLITVYTLNDPTQAELIKNLLNGHGIPCSLDGEHQAGFAGCMSIKVLVSEGDVDQAKEALERHHVDEQKE